MKNLFQYIIFLSTTFFLVGCLNAKKICKGIKVNREYNVRYIGTSNIEFIVINKPGLFKRNIAFSLPEYHHSCRSVGITDSFFVHKNEKHFQGKTYLIINRNDSTSFGQNVSICRAKAFLKYIDIDRIEYWDSTNTKVTHRMKASDGVVFVKAVFVIISAEFQDIKLFSNYDQDSAWHHKCDQKTK